MSIYSGGKKKTIVATRAHLPLVLSGEIPKNAVVEAGFIFKGLLVQNFLI
jgi:hypothetical protein